MSQKFVVELELGNDAMRTTRDVMFALLKVVATLEEEHDGDDPLYPCDSRRIHDENGNTVGGWNIDGMPDGDHPGIKARRARARSIRRPNG